MATVFQLAIFDNILDARTEREFIQGRIPSAINIPVLNHDQRAKIGALYQQDAFMAKRQGAICVANNIATHLQGILSHHPVSWKPLVYCARGGQRSGSLVEIMRRVGWKAEQLEGGYKSYRQHVICGMDELCFNINWVVISGRTGSGKTDLLLSLKNQGAQIINLEALANHRGSVFGWQGDQPSQQNFENCLFSELSLLDRTLPVFIESESRKIGALHVPAALHCAMRNSLVIRIEASIENRAQFILLNYKNQCDEAERCFETLEKLTSYVGKTKVFFWQSLLQKQQWSLLIQDLLTNFYDIGYDRSLSKNYSNTRQLGVFEVIPDDTLSVYQAAKQMMCCVRSMKKDGRSGEPISPSLQ